MVKYFVGFHEQLKKYIVIKNLFKQRLKLRQVCASQGERTADMLGYCSEARALSYHQTSTLLYLSRTVQATADASLLLISWLCFTCHSFVGY